MPNRETRRNAKTGQEFVIRITLHGRTYAIDVMELSALDEEDFEARTGLSLVALGSVMGDHSRMRLSIIAALVWLHRRRRERTLTYEEVAGSITLGDLMEAFDNEDQAAEEPVPEP